MQDLLDTWASERFKTLAVWASFHDADLPWRPEPRARSVHAHFVHQCVSEDRWFMGMLGIDLGQPPLPAQETREAFLATYAARSRARGLALAAQPESWWHDRTRFFDVDRSRLWVLLRRFVHTSHHRGQLTAYLRMLGRPLHSTYGPTADTGGLMADRAPTIYGWDDEDALLAQHPPRPLPGPPTGKAVSER